ncbi:unnamed protein product [Allacma fusca]|uniref:Uncharacterized protein n=1 Tax=Allacma fusca TaxID=39272 RepID=A0A8J2JM92_9HEXA|nr:unnamed protein product [Allacma fusca]
MKIFVAIALLAVFALGSEAKLTHSQALSQIQAAGVGISSSGGCSDRSKPTCTSLEQINVITINGVVTLKKSSGCSLTVTGGTEVGHASGTYSHYNGYKVDYSLNTCISGYITRSFTRIADRSDGAAQYRSAAGNIYALEGNHWDVTYHNNS